jgi:hypothetical protein
MRIPLPVKGLPGLAACLCLPAIVNADQDLSAVKLSYQEMEQGTDVYKVVFTVSERFLRIDDESDESGYIIFDNRENSVYSISHQDKAILVIPQYPVSELKADFDITIDVEALKTAPKIAGKTVYNYRVRAVTEGTSETCMDIQLVPGLLPDVAKTLQAFQKAVSGQQLMNLEATPEEFRTPCYLVDQVYNKGDYFDKGLPIQEWHSNERMRQLMNYENVKVDSSIFDIPAEYRQFSLNKEN